MPGTSKALSSVPRTKGPSRGGDAARVSGAPGAARLLRWRLPRPIIHGPGGRGASGVGAWPKKPEALAGQALSVPEARTQGPPLRLGQDESIPEAGQEGLGRAERLVGSASGEF